MSKEDAIEVEGKVVEPLPVRRQQKRIADSDDVMATAEDWVCPT
jgi:translation initiation factor IF-1